MRDLPTQNELHVTSFNINLEPIMVKAIDQEEGYGWSIDFTKSVAREYERYLMLCKNYPEKALVPSSFVDDFWHLHILDTLKYADDCDKLFGYFLHHFPYFGMRGEQDAQHLADAWLETRSIYEAEFGEAVPNPLWPKSKRCPNCGRRCKDALPNDAMGDGRPTLQSIGA